MNFKSTLVGTILVALVGVVLILAGFLKLIDVGADDMIAGLEQANLIQHRTLISMTAIVCGILLLIQPVRPVGILMASAYWGGAIVAHLTYNDSVIMPASFQLMLWVGAGLCYWPGPGNLKHAKPTRDITD